MHGLRRPPHLPCHSTLPQVGALCPQTNLLFVLYSDEKHNASKKLPREEKEVGLGKVLLGKHPSLVWNLMRIGLGWAVSCLQGGLDQRQAAWDSLGLLELLCPLDGVCLILGPPLGHL